MRDEIIEELWRVKDSIATEHGGNLTALISHLRGIEQRERHRTIDAIEVVGTTRSRESDSPGEGESS